MTKFELVEDLNEEYAVGTEYETERSAEDYADELIDDLGYDGLRQSFVEQYIDEDEVAETMRDIYQEDVYQNPEIYFNDDQRELSNSQRDTVRRNEKIISQLKQTIESLEKALLDVEEDEEIDNINDEIGEVSDKITELEEEIEEVKSEPDGDYPSDLVDEKVDELLEEVRKNPKYYITEYGMRMENYINKRELIKGYVNEEGYGILNSWDGSYEQYEVNRETFIVMRIS